MARAPNYAFERKERDRQKAVKAAEKAEAKRLQREADAGQARAGGEPADPSSDQG